MPVSIFSAFNFFIVFSHHKTSERVPDSPPTSQMATLHKVTQPETCELQAWSPDFTVCPFNHSPLKLHLLIYISTSQGFNKGVLKSKN